MSKIIPYYGYGDFNFSMNYDDVRDILKARNVKFQTEFWSNKGCEPEVPWRIIRIENQISIFFANDNMFKIYFENDFAGTLENGIKINMTIEEALRRDQSLQYNDWDEEYYSQLGYWVEDDPETHKVISISIFIKELENEEEFYKYEWCNLAN